MDQNFRFGNGNIHYSDQGSGKVIVLLHGYLETSQVWNRFAARLATGFRVVSIDMPGHGSSDIYSAVHTMEFIAEVLYALVKSMGISKIFLTGHSLGGYVTLAFAELYPEMLSGYCLFHSQPFADPPEAIDKREREIKLVKAGKKDLMYPDNISKMFAVSNLEKFNAAFLRSKQIASEIPGEGIISVLKGMMNRPSRLSVMEAGRVPCLWILGSMDNYIDCGKIIPMVRLPQNAKVVVLKNSGHMGFVEEEDRSLKVIARFADRIK
jgi:pimeloyl-ACP methyl ester carboxylesterase